MKKSKILRRPTSMAPATDQPTGKLEPGDIFSLFSLVDTPQPLLLYKSLFHSYNLDELKKELGRVEALAKQNNHPISIEQLREQIEIIELLNMPNNGVTYLKWQFEQADALHRELIYLLAKHGNMEAFESFSRKTHDYFWHLKRLASDGHAGALQSLATLAIEATEVVNRHAVKRPGIFAPVAAELVYWPFLKSLDKKLDLIKTDDEAKILNQINSGKNTQRKLSGGNRSDPNNKTVAVAERLLNYVRSIRQYAKFIYRQKLPDNSGAKFMLAQAAHLSDEMQDTTDRDAWWKLAKQCLLQSYPALDPTSDADLKAVAPSLLKLSQADNPKDRRKKILKNIKRTFETILAEPSAVPTKTREEVLARLKITDPDLYRKLQFRGIA